jgi:hypothetical protein
MKQPKPTLKQAALSQCHRCMGHYVDGKVDCEVTTCSLYTWMPYAKLQPDMGWASIHPRRRGQINYADIDTSQHNGEHLSAYRQKSTSDSE